MNKHFSIVPVKWYRRIIPYVLISAGASLVFVIACQTTQPGGDGTSTTSAISEPDQVSSLYIQNFDQLPQRTGLSQNHYLTSNEARIDLFRPYIENASGGYIGVGTDQNFTFIAWAKSSFAWLMDFDPLVTDVNKVHILFFKVLKDFQDFEKHWQRKNKKIVHALIEKHVPQKDWAVYKHAWWEGGHPDWLPLRLKELGKMSKKFKFSSFHDNPNDFAYLKKMAQEGRIQPVGGDLRGNVTLKAIAAKAQAAQLPIRVLYLSNAEDYFYYGQRPTEISKSSMAALPTDQKGYVVRTVSVGVKGRWGFPDGERYPSIPFHYNVQTLASFKSFVKQPGRFRLLSELPKRTTVAKGFSLLDKTNSGQDKKEQLQAQ